MSSETKTVRASSLGVWLVSGEENGKCGKEKSLNFRIQSICMHLSGGRGLELCGALVPKGSSSSHFLIMYTE